MASRFHVCIEKDDPEQDLKLLTSKHMEKAIIVLGALFMIGASPFVYDHIQENWDAPEYPHSGFSPECPTWDVEEE